MPNEETVTAPNTGTAEQPTTEQPQATPAAPIEGIPAQENQQGITATEGQKGKNEPFYQTKYQDLAERLTQRFGSIEAALQSPEMNQQQPNQPTPEPEPGYDSENFDPYDPTQMTNFIKANFSSIRANLDKVVSEALKKAQAEERARIAMESEFGRFNEWSQKNQVPQQAIDRAVKMYVDNFGMAGTPKAFVDTVQGYIERMGVMAASEQTNADYVKDAVDKARKLESIEQPKPGAAPEPTSVEKTPDEVMRDRFTNAGKKKSDELGIW